ncbi:MAG: PDZ domain-containing protein [Proteobacteria bacterium]|nr:PDZ domain-containing protein [Pseudomonadota bacterium]
MKKNVLITIFVILMSLICMSAFAQDSHVRLGLSVSPLQASPLLLQHLRLSEGEGLMINNVAVGGELEQSGLSQGDILLAIDGHALSATADLQSYLSTLPKNAQVTLDVIQKGEHRQVYVKLDNLPDEVAWKYAQPVTGGRRSFGNPMFGGSSFGSSPSQSMRIQIQPGNSGSVVQHSTYKSLISTPDGIKSTSVTINGSKDDPNTEIEVEIGSDKYQCRIGDIDKLPDEARDVVRSTLSNAGNFSFSFGFGGDDLMDEMMKRHQEQMRMMDEFFNQQFMTPAPDPKPKNNVLTPVEPDKNDIRS